MVHKGDLVGHAHDASLRRCRPCPLGVGHDAVAHLPCQVQALSVLFQPVHHTQALHIVLEAIRAELVQRLLTRMAKRRMSKIMSQRDCFHKIFIQPQRLGYGPGNLGYLEGMRQPRTVMVTLGCQKYLCLILKSPK